MKILPHDFLRAIETQRHQRLSPTNKQTNSENGHTLYLFFYSRTCVLPAKQSSSSSAFCFPQAMGWLLWLCRKFRSHLSRTYFVAAGTTTIRPPVVAYFDSGLSNTITIADSLYLLFYTACVCVFRPQEFGIRAITSSTTPHRHTLLPTVVLPIFSFFYFRGQ